MYAIRSYYERGSAVRGQRVEMGEQGQGQLALAQVGTSGLAADFGRRGVVQGVVHELEGDAQVQAELLGLGHGGIVRSGQDRAHAGSGLDEIGRLAGDDGKISGLVEVEFAAGGDLLDLTRRRW